MLSSSGPGQVQVRSRSGPGQEALKLTWAILYFWFPPTHQTQCNKGFFLRASLINYFKKILSVCHKSRSGSIILPYSSRDSKLEIGKRQIFCVNKNIFLIQFRWKSTQEKMKGALLLIGVLVCASMTEASSVRWAKKARTAMQNHRLSKDKVSQLIEQGKICIINTHTHTHTYSLTG